MSKTEKCAVCALGEAREVERDVAFVFLNKPGHYTVSEYLCAHCGESYVHDEQGRANEAAERLAARRCASSR